MNVQSQARRAYGAASNPTRTPKGTEYEALARVTHRMQSAARQGQGGFVQLVQALHDNKSLWNLFAIDVADPGNPLPADLRARVFYLAEFTHHHTPKVLAREAAIEPLLEVNTAVMRGLRSEVVR